MSFILVSSVFIQVHDVSIILMMQHMNCIVINVSVSSVLVMNRMGVFEHRVSQIPIVANDHVAK